MDYIRIDTDMPVVPVCKDLALHAKLVRMWLKENASDERLLIEIRRHGIEVPATMTPDDRLVVVWDEPCGVMCWPDPALTVAA